jgi:hypothetical protein
MGELVDKVGWEGIGFTVTETVAGGLVHPSTVCVTEYIPDALSVTEVIEGFCIVEENELGPVHAYMLPLPLAVRLNVWPAQIPDGALAVGADGMAFTETVITNGGLEQPFTMWITE